MGQRHYRGLALSLVVVTAALTAPVVAQMPVHQASRPGFETRTQLEEAERSAEAQGRTPEASVIADRLQHGDFQEGDKILLSVTIPALQGTAAAASSPDTVILRAGKLLAFSRVPNIPDLPLEGILRSELTDAITRHLSQYVRDPLVHAVPLLRVGVMGAVSHPGWYSATGDMVLADLIMQAGGVAPESNVSNATIQRASQTIWTSDEVTSALSEGLSLDRLHLRAGDEIIIPQKRQWNVAATMQIMAGLLAGFVALRTLK